MPPSATPPFNLREPPGRMLYSDMSDRYEVTEFESGPLVKRKRRHVTLHRNPRRSLYSTTGHRNRNGRSVVTASPNSIYSSSYAHFYTCNYRINRVLRIPMLEWDGPRGSTLYDTGPRFSLIRSLDTLHICVRRNFNF